MQSNINSLLLEYQKLSTYQLKAIENDNIEELEILIAKKDSLINKMQNIFADLTLNEETKLKIKELIKQDNINSQKLNQAKNKLGKSISKSKKMQVALQGYSKLIK